MRTLVEIGIVLLLIGLGWKQPYRVQLEAIFPQAESVTSEEAPSPAPATRTAPSPAPIQTPTPPPTRDSSWMWQKRTMEASGKRP